MPKAQGSRVELSYLLETTPGTTPGVGTWNTIRKTTEDLRGNRDTVESGEMRADREVAAHMRGNINVGGSINGEACDAAFDWALFSLMSRSAYTDSTYNSGGSGIEAVAGAIGTQAFICTDAGGPPPAGSWIETSGFNTAANNGLFFVLSVSGTSAFVAGGTDLVDEAAGVGQQAISRTLTKGTTEQHYSIRKAMTDIEEYITYGGCLVDSLQVSLANNAPVGLTIGINGMNQTVTDAAAPASTPINEADPYESFEGIIYVNGVDNGLVTSIDFSYSNNISDGFAALNRQKQAQFMGRIRCGGNISFFAEDLRLLENSINHDQNTIGIALRNGYNVDGGGTLDAMLAFGFPRVYFNLDDPVAQDEGGILLQGTWDAVLPAGGAGSMVISTDNV